jgi:hypothetical protein
LFLKFLWESVDRSMVKPVADSKRLAATVLAFGLSAAGALWWLGIWLSPAVRSHFDVPNARWWLDGLALADVSLFVIGHAILGLLMVKRSSNAQVFAGVTAGVTAYAWLSCVGMLRFHGSVLAAVAMFGAAVASCSIVMFGRIR